MFRNTAFSLVALLVITTTAQAGLLPVVQKQVNPGSAAAPYDGFATNAFTTDTALNAGALSNTWVSYALAVAPTAGSKLSALEVTITSPLTPNSGFHQAYRFDATAEAFVPSPSATSVTNGDSHLIVGGSQIFVAPNENNFEAGGPPHVADSAASDYGVGTLLNGLWGFDSTQQNAQSDGTPIRFAYLVIPRGSQPTVVVTANAATTGANGLPGPDVFFTSADFFPPDVVIPEPASLSLLGLALVGALGFRRHR